MSELDKILPAIAAAIGSVSKLGKSDANKHQGYNFASIDKFLEMVNPICADNGLIFHMQETTLEEFDRVNSKGEVTAWFRMHYSITVYHTSGQSLPPVSRSVEVPRTGAQASGSAQSYCLKQFMRSLFMIPTGDKDDADFRDHGDGVVTHTVTVPAPKPTPAPKRISSAEMKRLLTVLDVELGDVFSTVALDRLEKDWEGGMERDDWPYRDPNCEEYEQSFPKQVRDKFSGRRKELELNATEEMEPAE